MTADQMLETMAKRGLRITDQRRTLAKLFEKTESYLTPKEIYEQMSRIYSGLSFDTVYRNLRVMNEMGVLEQFVFEDGIKFRVHCQEHHHHHHLFCMGCDKTIPFVFCPMTDIREIPDNFQVVKHKFEIFGYCEDCRDEQAESSAGK